MGKLPHMWGQSLYILGSLMAEVRLQSYPTFYLFICLSHHMIRFAMNSLNSNDIFFLLNFDVIITFLPSLQHGGYGQCLTKISWSLAAMSILLPTVPYFGIALGVVQE